MQAESGLEMLQAAQRTSSADVTSAAHTAGETSCDAADAALTGEGGAGATLARVDRGDRDSSVGTALTGTVDRPKASDATHARNFRPFSCACQPQNTKNSS